VLLPGGQQRVRLHEKGGKYAEIPLHHTANEYLHAYRDAAAQQEGLLFEKETPLFRSICRGGGHTKMLCKNRLDRRNAWDMVKRRAKEAGLSPDICNHTFRGTGITNYLENGGSRDTAQELAGHEDVRTTALYDRRSSKISLDEIERMQF
jgi:integrase/recombinase XerD